MAQFPAVGKIGKSFFDEVIYPRLGATRSEVVLGATHGCDNAVIQLNDKQVLVVTTDPLSIIPVLGLEDSAWLTVHLLASDVATSGLAPQYAVVDLNLPPDIPEKNFEIYWEAFHQECSRLGIAVVAGHTGRFFGCNYTIVGGGMMFAVGNRDQYLAPTMAQPGDRIVISKGAAIATTGILARVFPEKVKETYASDVQQRAAAYFRKCSVVDDALTAASVGVHANGVTAMHDATEGGIFGAIDEVASAAHCGVRVQKQKILVSEETKKICELFQLDPYNSLSEGTLVAAVSPGKVEALITALEGKSIPAFEIGELTDPAAGRWVEDEQGREALMYYAIDPYWNAFAQALQKGWT